MEQQVSRGCLCLCIIQRTAYELKRLIMILLFLSAFAILRKFSSCLSVRSSVRSHRTTRLPLDGLSWILICVDLKKICRENSSLIKIWQEWRVLYMKISVHLFHNFAECFLEWDISQEKICRHIKTHILCSITFSYILDVDKIMWENTIQPGRSREPI